MARMKKERLRGVNLGGWFSQVDCIEEKDPVGFPGVVGHIKTFLGTSDFKRIHDAGFNHVRLPVDYFNLFKGDNLKPDEQIFALLDKALKDIQDADLDVILDLHKCPGHDFHLASNHEQAFFADANARKDTRKIWAFMAERYSSMPRVMMELLNEPAASDSKVWDKVKDEIFWEIRKHAPKNTIVVGANKWNSVEIDLLNAPYDGYDFTDMRYLILEGFTNEGTPLSIANVYFYNSMDMAIDQVDADKEATKRIIDGQLIIIKNGIKYNAQGTVIK